MSNVMRFSRGLAAVAAALSLLPLRGQNRSAVDQLLDRIVQHEQEFLKNLRAHSPVIETYIQEMPASDQGDSLPTKDHYFLGRMSLTDQVGYESFLTRTDNQKGSRIPFGKSQPTAFLPRGFAQMTVLDSSHFNRHTYNFDYVRREFLGEVRCLVFDVAPIDKSVAGQFVGSMWVEDKDYRIVRFNGTYTGGKGSSRFGLHATAQLYFHFDSWRVNVGLGQWAPAFVYVEESGDGRASRFKSQSRLWGFNAASRNRLDELTSILIDAESPVQDNSGAKDVSPLESQRSWEHQAEQNIVDRLEKGGLLAPKGDVDGMLNTVVNNLIVTNNLAVDAECRVLLTTPLETFSMGHTIAISRGLLDVLPDEASLAMVLAQELAHIALGHRTATEFAFHSRTMLSDVEILQRFRFQRSEPEVAAAGRKIVDILKNSPYKQKLGNAELFLKALNSRAGRLPKLIQATVGNQLASGETLARLAAFASQAPALQEKNLEQIAALPLGSRIKVDPWTNQITLMKAKPISLLSAREKMPFEVTPFVIHLTRTETAALKSTVAAKN
jgi:Peptidase family M48